MSLRLLERNIIIMTEMSIEQFKNNLEKCQQEYYLKEIKRIRLSSGQKKDIIGHTKEKFKFSVIFEGGTAFLTGAGEKIILPEDSKILKSETDSFIIRKKDGMIFLNTR
ncbi:MAG: hypothetical protein Q8920_02610 [Bacillota bacterium]|nr:hypothetical protein [Bacillota bacterium]